ncbi:MAG: hypothetical protein A2046_02775 [Bacteroidetes bacterium GWA2_30_7]|nr:MAG: hypothetical protein A2046_02775 [Bacteroidetes bacterium GWA2_30_7]
MESADKFEIELKEIYEFACKNGQNKVNLSFEHPPDNETAKLFIAECLNGFKKAQNLIARKLHEIEENRTQLRNDLEVAKSKKQKCSEIEYLIDTINYQECLIRKLADSIAWQIINGQHYIARRLYLNENPPSLLNSNINSVINTVNQLNSGCVFDFALISDFTSFIQIGDIFFKKQNAFHIIEVKEGEKNTEVKKIIDVYKKEGKEITKDSLISNYNKGTVQHILRFKTQIERGQKASKLLTLENGFDPKTDIQVKIIDYKTPLNRFYSTINELIQDSIGKNMAHIIIDSGSLIIGAYRNEYFPYGEVIMQNLIKEKSGKDFPVYNFLQNIYIPITEPIYSKPILDDFKFDIIFGRVKIVMVINYDKVIELFNEVGFKTKWLSRKETHKLKENKDSPKSLIIIDNRAIQTEYKGINYHLCDGFTTRIISDNLTPYSAIKAFIHIFEESGKLYEDK